MQAIPIPAPKERGTRFISIRRKTTDVPTASKYTKTPFEQALDVWWRHSWWQNIVSETDKCVIAIDPQVYVARPKS
jgi:hypothetical protein